MLLRKHPARKRELGTIVCVSNKFKRVVILDDDGYTHSVHKDRLRRADLVQRLQLLNPLLQRADRDSDAPLDSDAALQHFWRQAVERATQDHFENSSAADSAL